MFSILVGCFSVAYDYFFTHDAYIVRHTLVCASHVKKQTIFPHKPSQLEDKIFLSSILRYFIFVIKDKICTM